MTRVMRWSRRRGVGLALGGIAWVMTACAGTPERALPSSSANLAERDGTALFARAFAAQNAGDDARAIALLREVITLAPGAAAPHVNLGVLYRRGGRVDDAVREYEAAIRLDPDDAAAYHNLGLVQRARGKFADAERAYRRALELRPNQTDTHYNLGILYDLYLNRPQDALQHYRTVIESGGPTADTVAGWVLALERRLAQGQGSIRR
jgi:Flp pilus assembly protein TadD